MDCNYQVAKDNLKAIENDRNFQVAKDNVKNISKTVLKSFPKDKRVL